MDSFLQAEGRCSYSQAVGMVEELVDVVWRLFQEDLPRIDDDVPFAPSLQRW